MTTLNYADKFMIGGQQPSAVYLGSTKVWPASFKPADIANCIVWVDASKSYWDNLGSGSATTILGSPNPVFRPNALNGLPVLKITKGQGRLRFTGLNVDKDWTIIYVGRKWQTGTGRIVTGLWSGTGSTNILIGHHGSEYECAYIEGWINTPGGQLTAGTDWKMYSSDSTANGFGRLFSDGVYLGQFGGPSPARGWNGNLNISGWTNDADPAQEVSQQADCEIAELVMYNRKLTTAERQQLENYLRVKWNPIVPYKPNNISGCVVWLDASQLALADGASVTAWPNLGTGPQPTIFGSPNPVIRANALNGKPVVKITGAQGTFRFSGTGVDRDYTVAIVARKWTTKAGRILAGNYSATTSNVLFGWWSTRSDCSYNEGWLTPDDVHTDDMNWRFYTGDASSTLPARLFKDGAVLRSGAATPSGGLKNTLCISGHDDTKTESADCEVAELVMFNRRLSDIERAQLEQYLRLKWAPPAQLFTPRDLGPNLIGWFDSRDSSQVILAGAGVSQWKNKFGGGLTLTQTNDAYRPTYAVGTVIIGNPQNFVAANAPAAFDIIWVGKPRPAAGNDWRTLLRGATAGGLHHVIVENGATRIGTYNSAWFPATRASPNNMTSDSAPAPYVTSQNGTWTDAYAFKAFDGVNTTFSHSGGPVATTPYWTKIDLGEARKVVYYSYRPRHDSQDGSIPWQQWRGWTLQGSNDNSNWTLVHTVANAPNFALSELRTYTLAAPATFRYWMWTVTDATGYGAEPAWAAAAELGLHEDLTWDNVYGIGYARLGTTAPATISRDGGNMVSTGTVPLAADLPFVSFGAYQGPPPSQGWGDINEAVFMPYNSSESLRAMAEGYLAHRHGLTALLPANHPYKSTPP